LETSGKVAEITQLVKSGSGEMREGGRQVITEGNNLEAATQEIANGLPEIVAGAEQINTAVNRINSISVDNKENITILVNEVSRFKVETYVA
jgi:methyl-accepting chemotaxis protein